MNITEREYERLRQYEGASAVSLADTPTGTDMMLRGLGLLRSLDRETYAITVLGADALAEYRSRHGIAAPGAASQ